MIQCRKLGCVELYSNMNCALKVPNNYVQRPCVTLVYQQRIKFLFQCHYTMNFVLSLITRKHCAQLVSHDSLFHVVGRCVKKLCAYTGHLKAKHLIITKIF